MATKFSFRFGMTITVGDYSNVRPEFGFEDMEIPADKDPFVYISDQVRAVINSVHGIADDELETHGRTARYSGERLYRIASNESRKCIVVYPAGVKLPRESTWKEQDNWSSYHTMHIAADFPSDMRLATATRQAKAINDDHPDFELHFCMNGIFSNLPPLPDPGPEPMWNRKGLEEYLGRRYLDIPQDQWEDVAVLDYVNKNYLSLVYELTRSGWKTPAQLDKADALAFILENRPFPSQAEVEPDPEEQDDWDADYEEDYDDD